MTDLDTLKQGWQEAPDSSQANTLGKEELMGLVRSRTADIKKRTLDRVRSESYNYLVMLAIPALMLLGSKGLTAGALLGSLGALALPAPILAVLGHKEYKLRTLPLGGTLQQTLNAIVGAIDSTSRFYMFTYMLSVFAGVAVAEGLLVRRYGAYWIPAAALVGGMAFLVWAYRSGQAYVRAMFGPARLELTKFLDELEGA